jgi:argininosuccinate lyase
LSTLWHGRFADGPADELLAFTVSLPFDRRLAGDDIAGSRAHVRGLGRVGLLEEGDVKAVLDALDVVEAELRDGSFTFAAGDEDIHTAVERRVTELAGDAGARLHTGRSRNDQVATDLRLFAKRELKAGGPPGARPPGRARRPGRGRRRRLSPGLHPPPEGPARAVGPSPAGACLGPHP